MPKAQINGLTYSLVQQQTDKDCGVACVAMYARVSYEEALKAVTKMIGPEIPQIGMSRLAMRKSLAHFGIRARESWKFFDGLPCIVSVPSLNMPAAMHYVFWDGNTRTVLDPQANKPEKISYTKEFLYRGWSSTMVDINAAAEGMGLPVEDIIKYISE